MNEKVFKIYYEVFNTLNDDEKGIFDLGFKLGIGEGVDICTQKLKKVKK